MCPSSVFNYKEKETWRVPTRVGFSFLGGRFGKGNHAKHIFLIVSKAQFCAICVRESESKAQNTCVYKRKPKAYASETNLPTNTHTYPPECWKRKRGVEAESCLSFFRCNLLDKSGVAFSTALQTPHGKKKIGRGWPSAH